MGGVLAARPTIDRWEGLIRDGHRDVMVREFLLLIAGYSDEEIDHLARGATTSAPELLAAEIERFLRPK